MTKSRIGLIAGSGQFPIIFSKEAQAQGYAVYAVAYKNEADAKLEQVVEMVEWLYLGQVKRVLRFFKQNNITEAVMMGGICKPNAFSSLHFDSRAISILARMRSTHDDGILRAFAQTLEKEGIKIKDSTFLLPGLLAPAGCWTKRKPSKSEKADITLGWRVAKEIGRLDVGQCIVVLAGSVLAVEAIDGTDATIKRGGQLGQGQAVVVKVCKPNQDRRFDVPAVGVETIRAMQSAGAKVLAIEAEQTVVFDRQEMVALADRLGMIIVAQR